MYGEKERKKEKKEFDVFLALTTEIFSPSFYLFPRAYLVWPAFFGGPEGRRRRRGESVLVNQSVLLRLRETDLS